ncbi:MAG TPA: hypothetical protein VK789_22675 [Bryobacteraceae bacterium]|nr:hypothetical protein [Bryobacteraceae bacterium]
MMRANLSAILALGLFAGPAPLFVHHSFAAEFDQNKVVTLNGTITVLER